MQKRNIPVGAILGVGLLGTLIALGQDSRPPRPRAITPPPASDAAPSLEKVVVPANSIDPKTQVEAPYEPPLTPVAKNPIQPVQHTVTKPASSKTTIPDVKDFLPPLPQPPVVVVDPSLFGKDKATPPLPPIAPTNDPLPPPTSFPPLPSGVPLPVAPPKAAPEPVVPPPVLPQPVTAPPKPWSPTDTPPAPKDLKAPEPARPPVYSTIEMSSPRPASATPVSNPTAPVQEGPSRFVVPPKAPRSALAQDASDAPPTESPPSHGIRRLQPVLRPTVVNKAPGPLPKLSEGAQPTVPNLQTPAQDPVLGVLTPQLTVEKRGPLLHKVGGPMQYQIVLRNVGAIAAQQVRIEDEVPGAQVITTIPGVTQQSGERLVWILPSLRPGEERVFMEDLQPVRPGDVVSTTSVHVFASTSFRTKLDGDIPAPLAAPSVVPAPFAGPSLATPPSPSPSAPIPSVSGPSLLPNPIAPAPSPPVFPTVSPLPALPTSNSAALTAPPKQSSLPQQPSGPMPMTVDVKALPIVKVGHELIFEVVVSNKGTTPLKDMWLYGKIPEGFSHPEGDNIGAPLPLLGAGETKSYNMPVTAARPGRYTVEIRVTAEPNFELIARPVVTVEAAGTAIKQSANEAAAKTADWPDAKSTSAYQADGFSPLQVQVQSKEDPLEEGKATIYQVRIKNMGTSAATNVRASIALSSGLKSGHVQAPVAYELRGNDLVFQPIANLAAGQTKTIFVEVRGVAIGQQSVRAQVVSDQLRNPISREERTQVYRAR